MHELATRPIGNLLLASLTSDDRALFTPHLRRVSLNRGDTLVTAGAAPEMIYFPERAVVSSIAGIGDGPSVEIGIFGSESMTNLAALFGCDHSPLNEIVDVRGGSALAIPREALIAACAASERARAIFLRAAFTFSVQMGRTIAINLKYAVEHRLARWILMRQDRLGSDGIEFTHQYIAAMLGVRRATVTHAMHALEGEGAVRNVPGRIHIRDRSRLERIAGAAYGVAERQLHRLMGSTRERREASPELPAEPRMSAAEPMPMPMPLPA